MIGYFRLVLLSAWAFVQGVWITLRYLFKPSVTVHYPSE